MAGDGTRLRPGAAWLARAALIGETYLLNQYATFTRNVLFG